MAVILNSLGEQQARHLLQGEKSRNLTYRALGVAGDTIGVGKRQQRRTSAMT